MYKSLSTTEIKKYELTPAFYTMHKEGVEKSDFGMDNSRELVAGGFGLYSSADLKKRIGPIKTEYFRIALIRSGTITLEIGLETFHPVRNSIVFGFPGQLFSLYDQSDEFLCYYMLFSEKFVAGIPILKNYRSRFPFLSHSGVQSFQLEEEEACGVENFILTINDEIKSRKADMGQAIRSYIQLILIQASRNYGRRILDTQGTGESGSSLFSRFLKLVSQHFLTLHKVSDYAGLLHVSPDHLNRIIKSHSDKTAHELIDDMILLEAKAYLKHSSLSVAEIAYKLEFSDPSHFNKFFRKHTNSTPLQYREKSE